MKLIKLSQGQFAKVSDHRFDYLNQWKWHAQWIEGTQSFYACRWVTVSKNKREIVKMHKLIAGTPKGYDTDHRNGNTLDNQDENLRTCTHQENMRNRGAQQNNKSGYKGVCWNVRSNKWVAQITLDRKKTSLGYFENKIDAAKEYDRVAKIHFGEFAYLNFPDTVSK